MTRVFLIEGDIKQGEWKVSRGTESYPGLSMYAGC